MLCLTLFGIDFKDGHKYYTGQKMKLENDEVLVMEGIHCLNDKLTPAIPKEQKFKIYISALTVLNIDIRTVLVFSIIEHFIIFSFETCFKALEI